MLWFINEYLITDFRGARDDVKSQSKCHSLFLLKARVQEIISLEPRLVRAIRVSIGGLEPSEFS